MNPNPDAGGRPARSALLELIAKWRSEAEQIRAATPTTSGTLRVIFEASMTGLRVCAAQLETALEAAGLAAGDRPSLDDEVRCVNCGHGRKYHLQGRNSCFFFFGDSVCNCSEFQSEAAGDRPSLEPTTFAVQVLKNYGADVECGACMEVAFTGMTTNEHTCQRERAAAPVLPEPPHAEPVERQVTQQQADDREAYWTAKEVRAACELERLEVKVSALQHEIAQLKAAK